MVDIFKDTAVPHTLYTDNVPPFQSFAFLDFLRRWGVRSVNSSPYHSKSNSYAENGVKQAKALLRKCTQNGKLDYESWCRGLLNIRNTPHKVTGLSPAILIYGHPVQDSLPVHKSAMQKSWHEALAKHDHAIAEERQKMDKYRPGRPLPVLTVGTPVVVRKYGIVQERNVKARKYAVRLSSGMVSIRNRIDLRVRHPPPAVHGGTNKWSALLPSGKTADRDQDEPDTESDVEAEVKKHAATEARAGLPPLGAIVCYCQERSSYVDENLLYSHIDRK